MSAAGYIGGDALATLVAQLADFSYSVLIRTTERAE